MKNRTGRNPALRIVMGVVLLGLPAHLWAGEVRGKVLDAQGQPVEYALVSVTDPSETVAAPAEPAVLNQKNFTFQPRVLPVVVGTTVEFRNSDPETHNVHCSALMARFNFSIEPSVGTRRVRFDHPEVVRLLCDVHSQMFAYIVVLKTPHFAVSNATGEFVLSNLTQVPQTIQLWYEGKDVQTVSFHGEPSVTLTLNQVKPVEEKKLAVQTASGDWDQVIRDIHAALTQGVEAAGRGEKDRAKKLVDDAYFGLFEAKGMETAIRQNISRQRASEVENMFYELRQAVVELAGQKTPAGQARLPATEASGQVTARVDDLVRELRKDADALRPEQRSAKPVEPSSMKESPDVYHEVQERIRVRLDQAFSTYTSGKMQEAADLVSDTYFEEFHRIEPDLKVRETDATIKLEQQFTDLRYAMASGISSEDVASKIHALNKSLGETIERVVSGPKGAWATFFWSMSIIIREGFEAILILAAIVAFLIKSGSQALTRTVYLGAVLALVASVLTAVLVEQLLQQGTSAVIEGVTMLLASAVLVYVSYWFVSKLQAMQWQKFVMGKVNQAVSRGSRFALAAMVFLAIYREGAETIIFYQGLRSDSHLMVLAGFVTGCVALFALYWIFRMFNLRIALRPFFIITSSLLFVMAFVFAGQGVAELQEAGTLPPTPFWPWVVRGFFGAAALAAAVFFLAKRRKTAKTSAEGTPASLAKERTP